MMQKNAHGKLERKLVALLARGSAHTAASLLSKLRELDSRYSLQAVYYVLRKLRREGVAIRMKREFSLSLPWALELLDLARNIEDNFLRSAPAAQLIPAEKSRCSWIFKDLFTLDDIWVQLMMLLAPSSADKTIWNYCPHPWFYFSQRPKMERFYRALMKQSAQIKLVIGGETRLDRLFAKAMPKELYSCSAPRGGAEFPLDQHLMVIGDYCLQVDLSREIATKIDASFAHAIKGSPEEVMAIQAAAGAPTRARLSVAHSPKRAANVRRQIASCFP